MSRHASAITLPSTTSMAEKRRRSVPFVVVLHGAQTARIHRQTPLRAVEGLDLALFIARKHQCMLGLSVQPYDINQFLDKSRIVRNLKRLDQVRLQPVVAPHARNDRIADAHRLGQRSRGPMRGVGRLLLGCPADEFGGHRARRVERRPPPACSSPECLRGWRRAASPNADGAPSASRRSAAISSFRLPSPPPIRCGHVVRAVRACFALATISTTPVRSSAVNVTAFATRMDISSVYGGYYASRHI